MLYLVAIYLYYSRVHRIIQTCMELPFPTKLLSRDPVVLEETLPVEVPQIMPHLYDARLSSKKTNPLDHHISSARY